MFGLGMRESGKRKGNKSEHCQSLIPETGLSLVYCCVCVCE